MRGKRKLSDRPEEVPRRSKRLREQSLKRQANPTPPPSKPTTNYKPPGTFPLASLLWIDTPVYEHLLPKLSLEDLSCIEMVNKSCLAAVRAKGYWKTMVKLYLESDGVARKVHQKYTTTLDGDDPLYYRRLCCKLKADLKRLERNISKANYKEASICLPSDSNSVTTDDTGRYVFAAGENQVDVFVITETRKGAVLKLAHHINWEGKFPAHGHGDGESNATHSFLAKSHGDLLFVAHFDGMISVWNWWDQSLLHVIRAHVETDQDFDNYFDIPVITAMQVKQDKLIVGLWSAGPVTIWQLNPNDDAFKVKASISLEGYASVHAVDVDGHLGVIAYDRTPNDIHHICIWDIDKGAVLRFITAPEVRSLSLLCAESKLLAGSIRMDTRAPLLQLFDVTTGRSMVSFKTDKIGPVGNDSDSDDDFFLEGGASVWTDWKEKIVCGFTNGTVGIYDLTRRPLRPEPIVCFKRKRFSETYPCWIKDVSFDGIYLVFNHESDVCLFDFLKLSSCKF